MSPATITQASRHMQVTTPLGQDVLFLTGFAGREGISQLFYSQLRLLARNGQDIALDSLLGQPVTVRFDYRDGHSRFFNGIVNRVSQGMSDGEFTSYHLEMMPRVWLLTNQAQCRIFQRLSVPEILRKVLEGFDVEYQIQGTFYPREYCVQYRESDFDFISRLMEEEGIYYFFKHTDGAHKLVLANTPQAHPDIPEPGTLVYHGSDEEPEEDGRNVYSWSKAQELRPGKYTLYDQHFEFPRRHLEAERVIHSAIEVGETNHRLRLPANERLEIYDYPGDYAHRFDGVSRGGGDQSAELQRIFEDNQRTAAIRMQQEAVGGLSLGGTSDCRHLFPGHKFMLTGHANANGAYVVLGVSHSARNSGYRSEGGEFSYHNSFSCIPLALPYRPPLKTPRPSIQGTQTAVVVGPAGEEIFTDKYGRVKVQFPWDREGRYDADSSCWVRVAQPWAGKRWGASFWPRIGQEVVVAFEEGNPDRPIIVGSVYNAEQMPPYLGDGPDANHANDNKVSGIKTCSTPDGEGFNELRFDDTKGKEQVFLHAERDLDVRVKGECRETVAGNRHLIVGSEQGGDYRELIHKDKHLHVKGKQVELIEGDMLRTIGGNQDIIVKGDKKQLIEGSEHAHVKGGRVETVEGDHLLSIGKVQKIHLGFDHIVEAGRLIQMYAGANVIIEAGAGLSLKVGNSFITLLPDQIQISSGTVFINSGGGALEYTSVRPGTPTDPTETNPLTPDSADNARSGWKSAP